MTGTAETEVSASMWTRYRIKPITHYDTINPDDARAIREFIRGMRCFNDDGELEYHPTVLPMLGWELVERCTGRVVATYLHSRGFKLHDTDLTEGMLPDHVTEETDGGDQACRLALTRTSKCYSTGATRESSGGLRVLGVVRRRRHSRRPRP